MKDTRPKPFVFVLMPFDSSFSDVYELGIKPACADAGAYAERVDEQIFHESILQRIYNQIAKADVIVADMTGRSPNVFYETGYAHALGKNVILLTRNADDIPFDLKHYPHIVYGGAIRELKPELTKRVRWAVENAPDGVPSQYPNLQFFFQGCPLSDSQVLELDSVVVGENRSEVRLQIDVHRPSDTRIEPQEFRIAFITSALFNHSELGFGLRSVPANTVKHPNGGYIHQIDKTFVLYPDGWEPILITFNSASLFIRQLERIIIRAYTHLGTVDLPLTIKAKNK